MTATDVAAIAARRQGRTIAVCIPARDEAATIPHVLDEVATIAGCTADGDQLVREVLVVDDGSSDHTAAVATAHHARVVSTAPNGKGQALRVAVAKTVSDILVFLDADVTSFRASHVADLVQPLLDDPAVALVKPIYDRHLPGRPDEGGRVNELVARPLLRLYWPELAHLRQPLAGEVAIRRTVLDKVTLADGYGIEFALLVDVAEAVGVDAIAEVHLGTRVHRNRPLHELTHQAEEIIATAMERVDRR